VWVVRARARARQGRGGAAAAARNSPIGRARRALPVVAPSKIARSQKHRATRSNCMRPRVQGAATEAGDVIFPRAVAEKAPARRRCCPLLGSLCFLRVQPVLLAPRCPAAPRQHPDPRCAAARLGRGRVWGRRCLGVRPFANAPRASPCGRRVWAAQEARSPAAGLSPSHSQRREAREWRRRRTVTEGARCQPRRRLTLAPPQQHSRPGERGGPPSRGIPLPAPPSSAS